METKDIMSKFDGFINKRKVHAHIWRHHALHDE